MIRPSHSAGVLCLLSLFLLVFASGLGLAQADIPRDLFAMADTEREFAKTATVKGWRDAFLDFFADDAVAVTPKGVFPAKERLRKLPSTPFSEFELLWEPRLGDVSSSGDLGWLTGPSTAIDRTSKDTAPGYGCYLSIWRRQPDGRWRVFIDVGADAPTPVPFAPGLTRMAFATRYTGKGGKDAATRSLAEADRDLNLQITRQGTAAGFKGRLTPASRLHRPGHVPIVATEAIVQWMNEHATASTAKDAGAEAAADGDIGYTHGTFDISAPSPLAGAYVRVWNRDASGRWWLIVDVAQPGRP